MTRLRRRRARECFIDGCEKRKPQGTRGCTEETSGLIEARERDEPKPVPKPIAIAHQTLEIKSQGKLDQARVVDSLIDNAKARAAAEVLHAGWPASQKELRVIEQVEELGAELEIVSFVNEEILEG
jgi:hypothetical protein